VTTPHDGGRELAIPPDYATTLAQLKQRIGEERLRVVLSANRALVRMYWDIGRVVLAREVAEGWGAKVVTRLAHDLSRAFPDMKGFSPRNIRYMRAFAEAWPDPEVVQQVVARIPWGQNLVLLERLRDPAVRAWYAQRVLEQGWSRSVLALQIDGQAWERSGKAVTNFSHTLPPPASDLAVQVFKDPYLFDFLGTADPRREAEVERALVQHVQQFLLELGIGFAFVGRQVRIEVGDKDFYVDLLFYHLGLRCFVVIELKAVPFEPSFTGQLSFYLAAIDDRMRHPTDGPTIGLLLCRGKDRLEVEYALRGLKQPVGVADWQAELVRSLPDDLAGSLPTVEELEAELALPTAERDE
jgi:predicted nuclease of restriction endonuclease-like (RecB) superfamily